MNCNRQGYIVPPLVHAYLQICSKKISRAAKVGILGFWFLFGLKKNKKGKNFVFVVVFFQFFFNFFNKYYIKYKPNC